MIEERLYTLLNDLVDGRMYPSVAPGTVSKPYVVYTGIASTPEVTLESTEPINNARMQIDCYDNGFMNVQTLSQSIRAAMRGWSVQNVPLLVQNGYDTDANLHRVTLDYSIWYHD